MLRRPAEKILVNSPLVAKVLNHNDTAVSGDAPLSLASIFGIEFPLVGVVAAGDGSGTLSSAIRKYCAAPCTNKKYTVTVTLPVASCGCIEEWVLKLKHRMRGKYDLNDIRPIERVYTFDSMPNSSPTATEIKDFIVAAINADKSNEVVAISTGASTFTIEGEGCRDFDIYLVTGMGSFVVTTPYVAAILTAEEMYRMFPVRDGFMGHAPLNVPSATTYCKYSLTLTGTKQDLGDSQGYINFTQDVELYVNNLDANFAAFDAALEALSLGGAFA